MQLDPYKIAALAGDHGDRVQFSEFIQKNLHLDYYRTGLLHSVHAAASFTRRELSDALREHPYFVNILLGGIDDKEGASLYFIDYLGAMHKVQFGAHGYSSSFLLGLFDRLYKPNLIFEEGVEIIKSCISEIRQRFLINTCNFIVKVVDKQGVRRIQV
jgi:20S proteasome subunit beta 4